MLAAAAVRLGDVTAEKMMQHQIVAEKFSLIWSPPGNGGASSLAALVRNNLPNHGFLVRTTEGSAMPIQRQIPEVSDEEIHKLLREVEGNRYRLRRMSG